ncbi:MAG TPA: hypothetical protein VFE45_00830, partial [Coriobacteriia bacterium]|nr:hypothetical protein [Coriobacteriia bacterium]
MHSYLGMAFETPPARPRCCRIALAALSDIGRFFVDAGSMPGVKIEVSARSNHPGTKAYRLKTKRST